MRVKLAIILSAVTLALAAMGATAALAAAGGDKGNSAQAHNNRGQSQKAAASSTTDPSHDPSNPDGTYQGKSTSIPDQDGTGADHGLVNNDKTGPGTDGNNGCGNDSDREDDNNGRCGKPTKAGPPETPGPTVAPTETPSGGGKDTEVLGQTFTRPLARTGAAIMSVALGAAAIVLFGFALRVIARKQRAH